MHNVILTATSFDARLMDDDLTSFGTGTSKGNG